jgi:hypothetical protein
VESIWIRFQRIARPYFHTTDPHKCEAQSAKAFSLTLLPRFLFPREPGSGHLRFGVTDVPPQPNSRTDDNHGWYGSRERVHQAHLHSGI